MSDICLQAYSQLTISSLDGIPEGHSTLFLVGMPGSKRRIGGLNIFFSESKV